MCDPFKTSNVKVSIVDVLRLQYFSLIIII